MISKLNKLNKIIQIKSNNFSTQITSEMVKHLRQLTNAPLMDCKKALQDKEVDGDYEKAISWLHKKGINAANKKENRSALDGMVTMRFNNSKGMLLSINSETDFVAKNEKFIKLINNIADIAFESNIKDINELENKEINGITINQEIKDLSFKVGEKIKIGEIQYLNINNSNYITGVVHGQQKDNVGKYGSLLSLNINPLTDNIKNNIDKIAHDLCLHIIAAYPLYLSSNSIPKEVIDKKRELFNYEISDIKKTDEIKQRIIDSKLRQMYTDVCLLSQVHLLHPKGPIIEKYLKDEGKKMKCNIDIIDFKRIQVGKN